MIARFIALSCASIALSACVSVLPESGPPPDIYRLSLPTLGAPEGEPVAWIVELPTPRAPEAYSTDRIAVSQDGVRISYVADARWSASAPQLLQSLMVDSFNADGRVRAAVRPEDAVNAGVELRLELHHFEAVYRDGPRRPPTAELHMNAKLVDARSRRLMAAKPFTTSAIAAGLELDAIVSALDTVAHENAAAVIGWTIANGSTDD